MSEPVAPPGDDQKRDEAEEPQNSDTEGKVEVPDYILAQVADIELLQLALRLRKEVNLLIDQAKQTTGDRRGVLFESAEALHKVVNRLQLETTPDWTAEVWEMWTEKNKAIDDKFEKVKSTY